MGVCWCVWVWMGVCVSEGVCGGVGVAVWLWVDGWMGV